MEMEKTINEEKGEGEDVKSIKVLELNPEHEFLKFSLVLNKTMRWLRIMLLSYMMKPCY